MSKLYISQLAFNGKKYRLTYPSAGKVIYEANPKKLKDPFSFLDKNGITRISRLNINNKPFLAIISANGMHLLEGREYIGKYAKTIEKMVKKNNYYLVDDVYDPAENIEGDIYIDPSMDGYYPKKSTPIFSHREIMGFDATKVLFKFYAKEVSAGKLQKLESLYEDLYNGSQSDKYKKEKLNIDDRVLKLKPFDSKNI